MHLNKLEPGQKIILPGIALTLSNEIALEAVPAPPPTAPVEGETKMVMPEKPVEAPGSKVPMVETPVAEAPAAVVPAPPSAPTPEPVPTPAPNPEPAPAAEAIPAPTAEAIPTPEPQPTTEEPTFPEVPPLPTPPPTKPVQAPAVVEVPKEVDPAVEERRERKAERKAQRKRNAEVVLNPEKARLDEIVALPLKQRKKLSAKKIAKKINRDTVADLDDEEIKKVPQKAIQVRAKEVSAQDGTDPEMKRIFKSLKRKTATAYVGIRARFAFGSVDSLATRFRSQGAFAEIRDGWFEGLRLNFEQASKYTVKKTVRPYESLKLQRYHLGWAFTLPIGKSDFSMHLTPRVGRYTVLANLRSSTDPTTLSAFDISDATAVGGEFDFEWAQYFYLTRAFVGYESSSQKGSLSSTRAGVEAYIKGASRSLFGIEFVPSYLAFYGYENLKGKDEKTSTQMDLPISSFGFGIMLHID